MNAAEELKRRFTRVIEENVRPPVLIGPKWFRYNPSGNPAEFQFLGSAKIAKATGKGARRVAKLLLERIELDDLGMTAQIAPDGVINISSAKRKSGRKKKAKSAVRGRKSATSPS